MTAMLRVPSGICVGDLLEVVAKFGADLDLSDDEYLGAWFEICEDHECGSDAASVSEDSDS